jgi:hypothetical protein
MINQNSTPHIKKIETGVADLSRPFTEKSLIKIPLTYN